MKQRTKTKIAQVIGALVFSVASLALVQWICVLSRPELTLKQKQLLRLDEKEFYGR